jgi:hypothetical protein
MSALAKLDEYRAHTTGSERIHRHWLDLLYTDGIQFLAELAGAFWLIDAVASHRPTQRRHIARYGGRDFAVWRLRRPEGSELRTMQADVFIETPPESSALLECWSDTPDRSELICRQYIPYTDFPAELLPLEWYVENATMMLKEER